MHLLSARDGQGGAFTCSTRRRQCSMICNSDFCSCKVLYNHCGGSFASSSSFLPSLLPSPSPLMAAHRDTHMPHLMSRPSSKTIHADAAAQRNIHHFSTPLNEIQPSFPSNQPISARDTKSIHSYASSQDQNRALEGPRSSFGAIGDQRRRNASGNASSANSFVRTRT